MNAFGQAGGRGWRAGLFGAVFLLILGAKLVVLDRFASDLPNWDQWDAEGLSLFLPYAQGRLSFLDLFEPHNEHRLLWSKLLALGLLEINGQWDSRLECVANAILHAGVAVLALRFGWRWLPGAARVGWMVFVVVLTALPFSWHNAISGFHSQQYLLLLFSLPAVAWLASSNPGTGLWWAGLIFALAALFAQGSGLLAAVAAAGTVLLDRNPLKQLRTHWITVGVCFLVFALGAWVRVTVPYHEVLQAHSARDFALTFWRCLQWPAFPQPWFPLLAWAPFCWLAWRCVRGTANRGERALCAIGVWTLLQFLAMAYARGADAPWPAPRYLDTVTVGLGLNGLAALMALSQPGWRTWRKWLGATAALAGCVVLAFGMARELRLVWVDVLPGEGERLRQREDSLRAYLVTGDRAFLENTEIPYPGAGALIERVTHPELRRIMPAGVQAPLVLEDAELTTDTFARGAVDPSATPPPGLPVWGSHPAPSGRAATGSWRSHPLPIARGGYWLFRVAGDLEAEAGAVELRAGNGRRVAALDNGAHRRHGWAVSIVPAPRVATTLVARDSSTVNWVGFSGPTEMGPWSYLAWQAARWGEAIATIGLVVTLLLLLAEFSTFRRDREKRRSASSGGA